MFNERWLGKCLGKVVGSYLTSCAIGMGGSLFLNMFSHKVILNLNVLSSCMVLRVSGKCYSALIVNINGAYLLQMFPCAEIL